jgi:HEAT repeat protein
MPLIRRAPPQGCPPVAPQDEARAVALDSADPALRRAAAHAVAEAGTGAAQLAAALAVETEPLVREAMFTALIRLGDARALLPLLGAADAGLRGGAVGALQSMPAAVEPLLPALLADPDTRLRIHAAEIARGLPGEVATALLATRLVVETDPNAAAAAVDVLAEIGTAAAVPALRALAARCTEEPFLRFAVREALARLGEAAP